MAGGAGDLVGSGDCWDCGAEQASRVQSPFLRYWAAFTHVIAPYTVMKTPPWKLIVPTVCFDLGKYKKSETDPTLYRLHYSELLESFTDYTHIFTDGSKDGDKTAVAFICQYF